MTVFVEDTFDSAHYLPLVPVGHKCRNLHGHTYKVRFEISGNIDPQLGWVIDYAEIKKVWNEVKAKVDHASLNELMFNPTCENIVICLWNEVAPKLSSMNHELTRIELRETEHSGVVYEGGNY